MTLPLLGPMSLTGFAHPWFFVVLLFVAGLAAWVRRAQSGYLYHYALVMALGLFALLTFALWQGPLALVLRASLAWFPFFSN
jgi:Ca-activated chloride channel family protein